jgi:hypothetical protein
MVRSLFCDARKISDAVRQDDDVVQEMLHIAVARGLGESDALNVSLQPQVISESDLARRMQGASSMQKY